MSLLDKGWDMALMELRGRRAYVFMFLVLLILCLSTVLSTVIRANNDAEDFFYFEQAAERSEQRVRTGETTQAESADLRRRVELERQTMLRIQSIIQAPNSIQFFAQALVTAGTLIALIMGTLSSGSAVANGFIRTAIIHAPQRGRLLSLYFFSPLLIWVAMSVVLLVLAIVTGLSTPLFLDLDGPVIGASIPNLALAVVGIWLSGFVWTAVGVSLIAVTRSRSIAIMLGLVIWLGENILGSAVEAVQPFLPTFAAAEIVSLGTHEFYHALLLFDGHPGNPAPTPLALLLLIAVGVAVAVIGVRSFGKADIL